MIPDLRAIGIALIVLLSTACSSLAVTDRRYVMDAYMEGNGAMDGPDTNVENYREGAQGGTGGSAGGGCGCN